VPSPWRNSAFLCYDRRVSHSRLHRPAQTLEKRRSLKRFGIFVLSFALIIGIILLGAQWKPRKVECLTTEFTFCPPEVQNEVASLQSLPWWKVSQAANQKQEALLANSTEYVSVQWKWTWTGTVEFVLEPAPLLFPVRWEGQMWWVRGNESLTPLSEEVAPLPLLDFVTGHLVKTDTSPKIVGLSKVELESLAILFKQLQPIRPQIKRVAVHSGEFVELFPDGKGKIIVHIQSEDAVRQQVATLQAFFLSSTMNQAYQELDLRFENIIIR
jgi:hypothetical protein